jgi:hypothetical protein
VNDWTCQTCGNTIRDRSRVPSYCPRCGLGDFILVGDDLASPTDGVSAISANLPSLRLSPSRLLVEVAEQPLTALPAALAPPKCRPAKRIRPKDPLEVRLPRTVPLQALDVSATGLLVEHIRPFTPGSVCEVELWRSSHGIRLRAQVVRSVVSGGGKGSLTGIRYRTAVHFLETPPSIFTLLPELSEEASAV